MSSLRTDDLPCNLDYERLVLGWGMFGENQMDSLRPVVEADDFSLEQHRRTWAAMCALYDRGVRVERIVLCEEMQKRNPGEQLVMSFLLSLDEGIPHSPNIDRYIAVLKDKATLRRVLLLSENISKRCLSGVESAEEITEAVASELLAIQTHSPHGKRAVSSRELIDAIGMDSLLQPQRKEGVRLPWEQLNNTLCGLRPGQMIVLAAKTGRGKTSFALQVATHATKQGISPVIWTLEMSPRQMFTRMVNQYAEVDSDRGRHGALAKEHLERRKEAAHWLHGHPVWFDAHSRTVPSFCASVRQAKAKSEATLAIVDYLQLIRAAGRVESRTREVGENSRALKLSAVDLDMPFLVLSQFHRLKDDQEAGINSLKESGDIENDADVILLLDLPKPDGDNPVSAIARVAKQREGPAGNDIPLVFDPRCQKFYSPEAA